MFLVAILLPGNMGFTIRVFVIYSSWVSEEFQAGENYLDSMSIIMLQFKS